MFQDGVQALSWVDYERKLQINKIPVIVMMLAYDVVRGRDDDWRCWPRRG
jgi:hypothetical protein